MAPSERNWFRRWQQRGHAEMCIARQCHTSLESIQIDFSWKCIPEELYQKKKASFRKRWSVLRAPTSALPQCHTRRFYRIKRALTLLWYVSAVCPRRQIRLEPRTPSADLSLTPGLSLGQGQDTSFSMHSSFFASRTGQLNPFPQGCEKEGPEEERIKQPAVCCCYNREALVWNTSGLDLVI